METHSRKRVTDNFMEILYRSPLYEASRCPSEEGNNIPPPRYLIGGSCLSRIILVKNSRSLKARPFGSSGPGRSSCTFVVFRRPGIQISIKAPSCRATTIARILRSNLLSFRHPLKQSRVAIRGPLTTLQYADRWA